MSLAARAISPHSGYSLQLFESVPKRGLDKTGTVVEYSDGKPVVADFAHGSLLDHEIELAFEKFDFSGLPEGVNPVTRIGVFDVDIYAMRFPEEQREEMSDKIVARLRELQKMNPNQFIVVEQPAAERPFGEESRYDELTVEDILGLQAQTGFSPEKIRLYETEHQNRPEIIEAMERIQFGAAQENELEPITVEA